MRSVWPSGCLLRAWFLFRQNPDDVGPVDGQEGSLEQDLPVSVEDAYIRDGDELIVQVQFILNSLIPSYVYISAQQLLGCLHGGVDGLLGNNVRKPLAFIIIFN